MQRLTSSIFTPSLVSLENLIQNLVNFLFSLQCSCLHELTAFKLAFKKKTDHLEVEMLISDEHVNKLMDYLR